MGTQFHTNLDTPAPVQSPSLQGTPVICPPNRGGASVRAHALRRPPLPVACGFSSSLPFYSNHTATAPQATQQCAPIWMRESCAQMQLLYPKLFLLGRACNQTPWPIATVQYGCNLWADGCFPLTFASAAAAAVALVSHAVSLALGTPKTEAISLA
jgi:hypothetical protein